MNEIQKKLLEIAKEYIRVCDLLRLKYYAVGGTCLGAVRHGGFIPWDDDMDFAMPRKDYNIFVKKAPYLLRKNYFMQVHKTDKEYFHPYCKIRDSETTMIEYRLSQFNINHGCWIDVFPLDSLPNDAKRLMKYRAISSLYYKLLLRYMGFDINDGKKLKYASYLFNHFYICRVLFYTLRNVYCSSFGSKRHTFLWWNWAEKDSFILDNNWLGQGSYFVFENIRIRVPSKYNDYLKSHYGNWEKLPQKELQISSHDCFIDVYKSYKCYYKIQYCDKRDINGK